MRGENPGAARPDRVRQPSGSAQLPGRTSSPTVSRAAPRRALASHNEHGDGNPNRNSIPDIPGGGARGPSDATGESCAPQLRQSLCTPISSGWGRRVSR
jgi:hypothetical protein